MARKSKNKDSGQHIDRLRQRDGYASQKHDWQPTVGKAFREQIKGQVAFPPQRQTDPWIDSQQKARAVTATKQGRWAPGGNLPSRSDD